MPFSRTDWLLMVLVFGLSVGANLPAEGGSMLALVPPALQILLLVLLAFALARYAALALVIAIGTLFVGSGASRLLADHLQVDHRGLLALTAVMLVLAVGRNLFRLADRDTAPDGATAPSIQMLFRAVEQGNLAWTCRLLAIGADINVRNAAGQTPLMCAASKGYADMVQVLLQNGADPALLNRRGESAMTIALIRGYKRIAESLKMAEDAHRVERRDARGRN